MTIVGPSVFFTGEFFSFKNANFGDFFSKTHFLIAIFFIQFDHFHPFEQIFMKLWWFRPKSGRKCCTLYFIGATCSINENLQEKTLVGPGQGPRRMHWQCLGQYSEKISMQCLFHTAFKRKLLKSRHSKKRIKHFSSILSPVHLGVRQDFSHGTCH